MIIGYHGTRSVISYHLGYNITRCLHELTALATHLIIEVISRVNK